MKYIKCLNNSLKYVSVAMAYMLLGYSCSDDISELGDQPIKPKTEYKSLEEAIGKVGFVLRRSYLPKWLKMSMIMAGL